MLHDFIEHKEVASGARALERALWLQEWQKKKEQSSSALGHQAT